MLFKITKFYLFLFLPLLACYVFALIALLHYLPWEYGTRYQLAILSAVLLFLIFLCVICLFSSVKIESNRVTVNWLVFRSSVILDQVSIVTCHRLTKGPYFFVFSNLKKKVCFLFFDFFDCETTLRETLREKNIEVAKSFF